jgi:hypothetical protein
MWRGISLKGLIVFAASMTLGLIVPGGNTSLLGQKNVDSASSAFEAGATTHQTTIEAQTAAGFPSVVETPLQTEIEIPAPTRGTFMASWRRVNGRSRYLLDVSTDSSFSSYVNGYHNLDVGNVTGRVMTGLDPGTTYYYRVRSYDASGLGGYSDTVRVTTVASTGLIIHPTFDSSIINNPNAAAIEAMINRAISICESLFSDPITIQILFRYATTAPDGSPLPAETLSRSDFVVYPIPWSTFVNALTADARTSNDNLANASLPGNALSVNVKSASAGGRAVGLNTPPSMFADGTVGNGGPYDGIVTLNSSRPFQFTRPPSANNFDAQRTTEHEMDEVIGLGSHLNGNGSDLRPQDLFSWSSAGVRNTTSSGTRYFSINGGVTNIVNFNQGSNGDFGDWLSEACPQTRPYVQNAFVCPGQFSDIAATSPEGTNLDVIGYDLQNAPVAAGAVKATVSDFNGDGHPDYVLYNASTRQTAIWYLNNNFYIGGAYGPTLVPDWGLRGIADFNRDTHPDYALFNSVTDQTAIWYLLGPTWIGSAYGPSAPAGWELVATGDFNTDGYPDYALYSASTHQTAIWYLNNNVYVAGGLGPTLPSGWNLIGVADFNSDGHPDYALFNVGNGQTAIWYLSGQTLIGTAYGPTVPGGWALVATGDFNGDGHPDYVLYNVSTRQTAIWYLNNNVFISSAYGPTVPPGWSLVTQ